MSHKLTVLISGGGSNLAAIIQAINAGKIQNTSIARVIADRDCLGKKHALNANIPFNLIDRHLAYEDFVDALTDAIPTDSDLIVLAGFLSIIPETLIHQYHRKIINLHPSLLPKFGGAGMYGKHVHQAVLDAGESESGCSVHYVDSGIDTGEVIAQTKVSIFPNDSAETLQKRIAIEEHNLLVQTIEKLLNG